MEPNQGRWRSPCYQGHGGQSSWNSPPNRFRGNDRFYSPRMSPPNYSPYGNYRNSPPVHYNSPQSPYQQRSPYYNNNRPRQNFRHSSPQAYGGGRHQMRQPRGGFGMSRDDIENWILPCMLEDPWAELKKKEVPHKNIDESSADNQDCPQDENAKLGMGIDEVPSNIEETTSATSDATESDTPVIAAAADNDAS